MARAKFGSAKQVNDTELDQNDLFADDSEQKQEGINKTPYDDTQILHVSGLSSIFNRLNGTRMRRSTGHALPPIA